VAQLGARFHGMEEVESSNLSRSTNPFFHPLAETTPFTDRSRRKLPSRLPRLVDLDLRDGETTRMPASRAETGIGETRR
jgi:hypothetical protein